MLVKLARLTRPELVPFAVLGAVGFLVPLLSGRIDSEKYLLALAIAALALVARAWTARMSHQVSMWPGLIYVVSIALLRDSCGINGGAVDLLFLMPVIWMALWGQTRDLVRVSVAVAVAVFFPLLLIGAPRYPDADWPLAALVVCISAIVGTSIRRLLGELRRSSTALDERERERTMLVQQLEVLAHTDALTGLANRRLWTQQLERALTQPDHKDGLCVAILDVDGFKAVNDRGGHAVGDRLLVKCADDWRPHLRKSDVLARLGGDEFAVLLPACTVEDAWQILERIRLATPDAVTVSIGLVAREADETADVLLRRADDMLYSAKRDGRDRLRTYPGRAAVC